MYLRLNEENERENRDEVIRRVMEDLVVPETMWKQVRTILY